MRTSSNRLRKAHLLAAAALVGCGLISPSITTIKFPLPAKNFVVDTADAGQFKTPPGGVPAGTCGMGAMIADCCKPSAGTTIDCTMYPLTCEGSCTLSVPVVLAQ